MQDSSLFRKIICPTPPSVLLHRAPLVAQLQKALTPESSTEGTTMRYKLVLCCAPAGYGKTTLLADFVRSVSLPCCWYFLECADTDPVVFLRTLLASVRHALPQFGGSLDPLFYGMYPGQISPVSTIYQAAIDALCTALANEVPQRFAIILCNYEEINESETLTELINYLLKKLPPQMTLIIESRVVPDISFTSLIIRDALCGLVGDALRFSAADIAALARLQGLATLTDTEAEQLATSFDGWITGILLGTRLGDARFQLIAQGPSHDEHISPLQEKSLTSQRRKTLITYVINEVLKQDAAVHAFLQTISILRQIEPAMCNALLGITDAAERLARLERQGLFLTSYESGSSIIYTCHPVIRDLLSEDLQRQDPARFTSLHHQAIELWRASRNYEFAMYHALAINDYDAAVSLILDVFEDLLQQGQQETLVRWLHALPETLQASHPRLVLLQATIALERGQHDSALPLLEQAEALVPATAEAETAVLQAAIMILRSKALCQVGAYLQAQSICQQALLKLPEKEHALRAAAEMRLGICANLLGYFTVGITHLQQALRIWTNQPPLNQAINIHNALANTYYLVGNFVLCQHHLTHMSNACEQLQYTPGKVDALILQGLVAQDQGLASEAEAAFLQALTLSRSTPYTRRGEAYALVNLSLLLVEQGNYAQALKQAEAGLILARQWGNRSLTNAALSSLALSYLLLGDAISARLTVDQMETQTPSNGAVGYERVWHGLTNGMILLSEQRYHDAAACLVEIETALRTTDFKRGIFQVKLRLAACRIAQGQPEQALQLLEEVSSLLASQRNYIHLVQVELQWLTALQPIVNNQPQLASLRTLLGIAEPTREQPVLVAPPQVTSNPPRLNIYAFGEPTVLLDGQPIKRWRMARALELFFYLLDAAHPISKEAILTALWPVYDEQTTQVFHNTVYQLRKLLGDACVVFRPIGYSLDLSACYGAQVWYDVKEFQQQKARAEQALALNNEELAREAFLEMVQLYRGDYGQAFYNDWCTFRRDELRTMYVEARRQLAQIAWKAEAWHECAEHWNQILRIDNCLEEAHYGLMRCYVRQRKRGAALRQYQSCLKILQEELGVQPGQLIQNFYQRLIVEV
ncbi:MAG TPA: BTAD domain-containing putative transcriptional regulator [Ktedonosporobacter sp.]|nr:BTAD domain-containing putative transcriptional regulator [Ktedonosporobacter sp.]